VLLPSPYGGGVNVGAADPDADADDSGSAVTVTVTSGAVTVTVTGTAQEPPATGTLLAPGTLPAPRTLLGLLAATTVMVAVEAEVTYIVSPGSVSAEAAAAPLSEDTTGMVANTVYLRVSLRQDYNAGRKIPQKWSLSRYIRQLW
jgi:hypothetical protein